MIDAYETKERLTRANASNSERPILSVIVPSIGRTTLYRALRSIRIGGGAGSSGVVSVSAYELEIIVVGDSYVDVAAGETEAERIATLRYIKSVCMMPAISANFYTHDGGAHCWGQQQRNYGMKMATGRWLAFMQDDDIWTWSAWRTISRYIAYMMREVDEHGDPIDKVPLLFRCYMEHLRRTVWSYDVLRDDVLRDEVSAGAQQLVDGVGVGVGANSVWRIVKRGNIDANCIVVPNDRSKLGVWGDTHDGDWAFIVETLNKYGASVTGVRAGAGRLIDAIICHARVPI